MEKAWPVLAIVIATLPSMAGHAAPPAGVRLDIPPGYLSSKPLAPHKAASHTLRDTLRGDCKSHCVNFDEGYAWARARKIITELQCRGRSRAFVQGCMIYVTERRRQNR
jgi:hypothetical protein